MSVERRPRRHGFTLVEVLVALAITAGALVLLASSGNESMRRSVRARQDAQLEQLAESKLDEYLAGLEKDRHGEFAAFSDWRWEISHEPAPIEGLTTIDRVTLRVFLAGSYRPWRTYTTLRYVQGVTP